MAENYSNQPVHLSLFQVVGISRVAFLTSMYDVADPSDACAMENTGHYRTSCGWHFINQVS